MPSETLFVGSSGVSEELRTYLSQIGTSCAPVLIRGATGVGKEVVAKALHELSGRSTTGRFVGLNCSALPSALLESELFGHLKGAFTSAIKDRPGKFEMANSGTLFLDEVADMSLAAQAKVLRALQGGKIQRVGGDKDTTVDVRVIAATNKNLNEEIKAGRFREDLYHRLAVILIKVPPLKDRKNDIPLLVDYFSDHLRNDQGLETKSFSKEAINKLMDYPWTGNIRELRNVVERLMILGSDPVTEEDIRQFASKPKA